MGEDKKMAEFHIKNANKSVQEFKGAMKKCDIYDALNAYRQISYHTEKARRYAYMLMNMPPEYKIEIEEGDKLRKIAWDVEHSSIEMAADLISNCTCDVKK